MDVRASQPVTSGNQNSLKFIIVGDSNVGKTIYVSSLAYGRPNPHIPECNISCAFHGKKYEVDGITWKIQLWDTAGQERYR